LTLIDSTVANCTAVNGGGRILSSGDALIVSSLIINNTAYESGGIQNGVAVPAAGGLQGTMTVRNSTIANNTASQGGGIENFKGHMVLARVIAVGNSATGGFGGGLYNRGGSTTVVDSLFIANRAW
jgi:hypothetical protein